MLWGHTVTTFSAVRWSVESARWLLWPITQVNRACSLRTGFR